MLDLQPHRGDEKVAIPFTFDTKWESSALKISKLYIAAAACGLAIIIWLVIMFIAANNNIRLWGSIILLIGVPTVLRYALIEEYKYRKNYRDLKEHNYTYDYSLFWSIYDTSTTSPTFFYHLSGMNSLFVAFDKDVVIGKGEDSDFDHYEAISEAYNLLAKRGINCIHIDYMDNVGKDVRLQAMMEDLEDCPFEDLKNCVLDMYEYLQWRMSGTFADYDVYCFSSKMRQDLMLDELTPVLGAFLNANYVRYRILDRTEVRSLVSAVMSVPDFSVTRASDNLFASRGITSYIKIIWTEANGVREKVNKTRAEAAEEQRIQAAEREVRKANKKSKRTMTNNASVDLFAEDSSTETGAVENKADRFKKLNTGGNTSDRFKQLNSSAGNNKSSRFKQLNSEQGTTKASTASENQRKIKQGTTQAPQEEVFDLFGDDTGL